MKNKTLLQSLGHAVLVFLYIAILAWFMSSGEKYFQRIEDTFWMPVSMLMLFVFSAAVTGSLVLGRPILLYFNGEKSQALRFFAYTLFWLFVIMIAVFLSLLLG